MGHENVIAPAAAQPLDPPGEILEDFRCSPGDDLLLPEESDPPVQFAPANTESGDVGGVVFEALLRQDELVETAVAGQIDGRNLRGGDEPNLTLIKVNLIVLDYYVHVLFVFSDNNIINLAHLPPSSLYNVRFVESCRLQVEKYNVGRRSCHSHLERIDNKRQICCCRG